MRLLADENLPESMVEALRAVGHDVASIRDRGPGMPDDDVLALALAEHRLLVTRDLDFGELVVRVGSASAGVVILRYRRDQADRIVDALLRLVETHGERLKTMLTILGPARARLHALPRGQ